MELFIVQGQIKPVATSMALCTADIHADTSMAAFTAQNKVVVVTTSTVQSTAHPWVNPAGTSTAQSTVVQTALTLMVPCIVLRAVVQVQLTQLTQQRLRAEAEGVKVPWQAQYFSNSVWRIATG